MNKSDWIELAMVIGIVVITFTVILAPVISFILFMDYRGCRNSAQVMGVEYQWLIAGGCLVKVDDQFYPLGSVHVTKVN